MSAHTALLKKTEAYVTQLFADNKHEYLTYHNFNHTLNVVNKVNEIAGNYSLTDDDMAALFIAAWFHDTGYLFTTYDLHEVESVEIMKAFMLDQKVDEATIQKIESCIMATRTPRNPQAVIEDILCDADTYQFGLRKDFKVTNKEVFTELKHHFGEGFTKKKFDEGTIKMLEGHQFYTTYCQDLLKEGKEKIMKKVKNKLDDEDNYEEKKDTEITEKDGTTKGMQTMLRLTSSNHIQLSEMADSKANILISVNAIIISVILSVLLRKLQTDPYLTIPTILFLVFSVVTIVVSILATRPKVNEGTFTNEDVLNKKTNLLFFGNFHKMSYEQYDTAMRSMMRDSDYLYSSIIKDIFYLGQVLGKKYKLIRLAYNIFMVGIVVSVIAFTIAAMLNNAPAEGVITNSTGSPF